MLQTSFPVEYDFKRAKLDLIDKNTGTIKNKYKCLPLMITLPLSKPLDPIGPPNQPDPTYKQTIIRSTNSTDGWLNFISLENNQLNIISIEPNILFINKFSYNYDIIVDIINKGNDDVDLRFMAQNPFSLLASNMNDINLNETSFSNISNGQQIMFTITGEYQFLYINYPTTNFDINITITVSDAKTPVFICNKKCQDCTCFDIKGNGYIKIKNKGEYIYVPVYTTRIIGNTITQYLYPEFGYLRDLFYNITSSNSLQPPSNEVVNLSNPIIKLLQTTVIKCGINTIADFCTKEGWGYFDFVSQEDNLIDLIPSKSGCPRDQIYIKETNKSGYRFSWNDTPVLAETDVNANANLFFVIRVTYLFDWTEIKNFPMKRNLNSYILPAGFYDHLSDYKWISFEITSNIPVSFETNNTFDMTIIKL